MTMSPPDMVTVIEKGWGELFAASGGLWGRIPPVVLVHAPRTEAEANVVGRILRVAYQYATETGGGGRADFARSRGDITFTHSVTVLRPGLWCGADRPTEQALALPARESATVRRSRRTTTGAALAAALSILLSGCVVTKYSFQSRSYTNHVDVWMYTEMPELSAELDKLFHAVHPDTEVRRTLVTLEEFAPKVVAAAGQGDGPDVIIGNPVVDFPLVTAGRAYADITDFVHDSAATKHYPNSGLWTKAGRVYALQWRFADIAFWYNQDILDRLGIAVPTTWSDLNAAMTAVRDRGKGQYGGLAISGDPTLPSTWEFVQFLLTNGVNYCTIDSTRTLAVMRDLDRWRRDGLLPPSVATLHLNDAMLKFFSGQYAFALNGNWEIGVLSEAKPTFRLGTTFVPAGEAGYRATFAGESIAVGAFSKHKDLAWSFVEQEALSDAAQKLTFSYTGYLPVRLDTRKSPPVTTNRIAAPFAELLDDTRLAAWPDNPRTLDMQSDLGVVVSSLFAGIFSPERAYQEAVRRIRADIAAGGGSC
ncbi:MAG: extracellular solute-binding protein [Kutzneria sp.]|nr:extracellular solute-binding protein [Kutzneria sp.]